MRKFALLFLLVLAQLVGADVASAVELIRVAHLPADYRSLPADGISPGATAESDDAQYAEQMQKSHADSARLCADSPSTLQQSRCVNGRARSAINSHLGGGDLQRLASNVWDDAPSTSGVAHQVAQSPRERGTEGGFGSPSARLASASARTISPQAQFVTSVGHGGQSINHVAGDPSLPFIVSGDRSGLIWVWSADNGRPLRALAGHRDGITSLAVASGTDLVISGSHDGVAIVWHAPTATRRCSLAPVTNGSNGTITAVALSTNGSTAVVAGWLVGSADRGFVTLWDTASCKLVRSTGVSFAVFGADISPDGQMLALAGERGRVALWSIKRDQPVFLPGHDGRVGPIRFSPDGAFLAAGATMVFLGDEKEERHVTVWRTATREVLYRFEQSLTISGVAFSASGNVLNVASAAGVEAYDLRSGKRLWEFMADEPRIAATRNECILIGSSQGVLGAIKSADQSLTRCWQASGESDGVKTVVIGGRRLLLFGARPVVFDLNESAVRSLQSQQKWQAAAAALSSDGQHSAIVEPSERRDDVSSAIFGYDGDYALRVFEAATHSELLVKPLGRCSPAALEFASSTRLVVACDRVLRVLELPSGNELTRWHAHDEVIRIESRKNGELLFTLVGGTLCKKLLTWSLRPEDPPVLLHESGCGAVAFATSQDGAQLAFVQEEVAGTERTLSVIDRIRGTSARLDAGSIVQATWSRQWQSVAFSPDARILAAGSTDGRLILWNLATGNIRTEFNHGASVDVLHFASERNLLISGGANGTAAVWDLTSPGVPSSIRIAEFADGTWVVADSEGRFDTNGLLENRFAYWVLPDMPYEALSLDAFMREFFEPGLLQRTWLHEPLREVTAISRLNRVQPNVQIVAIEPDPNHPALVTVRVHVEKVVRRDRAGKAPAGQIGDVHDLRLLRDGHLVAAVPRSPGPVVVDPRSGAAVIDFPGIKLPTGRESVTLTAYAFNQDGVKSETSQRVYKLPKPLVPGKRRAYVLNIGIDAHENPDWNLRYAAADARAFSVELVRTLKNSRTFDEIVPILITSELKDSEASRPTKASIQAVFEMLAGKTATRAPIRGVVGADAIEAAGPDDAIIFTYSGHGFRDPDGTFYLFPFDIGTGTRRVIDRTILERLISTRDLDRWIRDIDVGSFVFIVDACNSASTVGGDEFRPAPMNARGFGQLAYDMGMQVLSASQVEEVALESDRLRHGLLTYALIREGLESKTADHAPQDGVISLREWLRYGVSRVPDLYVAVTEARTIGRGVQVVFQGSSPAALRARAQKPRLFDFSRGQGDWQLWRQSDRDTMPD